MATQAISITDTTSITYNGNTVSELVINGTTAWIRRSLDAVTESVTPMQVAFDKPLYRAGLTKIAYINITGHKGTTVMVNGVEVGARGTDLTSQASVSYTPGQLCVVRGVSRNTTNSNPVKLTVSAITLRVVAE